MADLKVDTRKVKDIAAEVDQLNQELDEGFDDVVNAINNMKDVWSSPSSPQAIDRFNAINDTRDDRKTEIGNFTAQLKVNVGQGYEETETENRKLADRLK